MREIKLEGNSAAAKLQHVEKILNRVLRKSKTHMGVHYPPIIISEYVKHPDEDGIVLRYMFPVDGQITKVFVAIEKFPEGVSNLDGELLVEGLKNAGKQYVSLKPPISVFNEIVPVKAGDRMTLRLKGKSLDLEGLWFAAKLDVAPSDHNTKLIVSDVIEEYYASLSKDIADESGVEGPKHSAAKLGGTPASTGSKGKSSRPGTTAKSK